MTPAEVARLEEGWRNTVKEVLAELMSEISEDCWCAGWLSGLEFDLWEMVQGGPRRFGMGEVSEEDVQRLRVLSNECGGWIVWNMDKGDTSFVPLAEWEAIYAAETERR